MGLRLAVHATAQPFFCVPPLRSAFPTSAQRFVESSGSHCLRMTPDGVVLFFCCCFVVWSGNVVRMDWRACLSDRSLRYRLDLWLWNWLLPLFLVVVKRRTSPNLDVEEIRNFVRAFFRSSVVSAQVWWLMIVHDACHVWNRVPFSLSLSSHSFWRNTMAAQHCKHRAPDVGTARTWAGYTRLHLARQYQQFGRRWHWYGIVSAGDSAYVCKVPLTLNNALVCYEIRTGLGKWGKNPEIWLNWLGRIDSRGRWMWFSATQEQECSKFHCLNQSLRDEFVVFTYYI